MSIPARLEVNIKISNLPNHVERVKQGHLQFCIAADDGRIVRIKVRPRIWEKMNYAAQHCSEWVASFTGTIGGPLKGGFILDKPVIQIYEKIPNGRKRFIQSAPAKLPREIQEIVLVTDEIKHSVAETDKNE